MAEKLGKKFTMPDSVKQFSFLNRWFIFKRMGETDMPKITLPVPAANVAANVAVNVAVDEEDEQEVKEEKEEKEEKDEKETDLPARNRAFKEVEIFRFGTEARQVDIGVKQNGKKDLNVSRWISLSAPFPIPDPDDPEIKYPSIEHYLAAMKLKTSNKPNLAKELMSSVGKIHQDFNTKRRTESVKPESPRDFELQAEETIEVRKKMTKTYLNQYRTTIEDTKWIPIKDKVLMDALRYRWEHDKRFRDTVETARNAGKYLLFSTKIASIASELGGTRDLKTGTIQGDNKVGRFIMEIAGFKF